MTHPAPLVVHVVYRLAVGGLENGLVNLVNRMPRTAWRHAIIALGDIDPGFARRIERRDVELVALGKAPGHAFSLYPRVWRMFRAWRPAIVHTRNLAALEIAPVAWAAGVAARVHGEHGRDLADPDGRNLRRQRIRRIYRPFVTRYIALSPDLETYLHDAIGVSRGRVEQIYNGVDIRQFGAPLARAPIAGCPFDAPGLRLVGAVGRLDPVKDHANLARAFAVAIARDPHLRETLRLVIVGDGPERARIERLLGEGGVRELAWLAGERDDVPAILRGLDVFVLPSLGEGVSNTVLEAMASGLPVVATRVGANAELIEDGATGRLAPAADPVALAEALAIYAADPELAKAHGRAGRARAELRFSLERMVEQYHRLYLALVEPPRGEVADTTSHHAPH